MTFTVVYGFGEKQVAWQPGFLLHSRVLWEWCEYWFYNLGIYTVLYPLLFVWLIFQQGKLTFSSTRKPFRFKKEAFPIILFLGIFSAFFVMAASFRLSVDMINNHKFINIFMIGMNIVVAGFLIDRWKKKPYLRGLLIVMTFFLTFSGLIDFFPIKNDAMYRVDDTPTSQIIDWIEKNTPSDSVFLTSSYLYNPASLAGRKIFIDHGYFAWSLGYNDRQRRMKLQEMFSSTITHSQWCILMKKNNLEYVMLSPGKGDLGDGIFLEESFMVRELEPEFVSEDNFRVYKVAANCEDS